jgi:hypothetical protein
VAGARRWLWSLLLALGRLRLHTPAAATLAARLSHMRRTHARPLPPSPSPPPPPPAPAHNTTHHAESGAAEQLSLELPAALQAQLLEQYDLIHDDGRLLPLPRRPNVMSVFEAYVGYVRGKQGGASQAEEDLVAGLQVCLGVSGCVCGVVCVCVWGGGGKCMVLAAGRGDGTTAAHASRWLLSSWWVRASEVAPAPASVKARACVRV